MRGVLLIANCELRIGKITGATTGKALDFYCERVEQRLIQIERDRVARETRERERIETERIEREKQ
ncbi:hypothetical protein CDG77_31105 [Nostoc sp. 'Peltigera membranacea cyanobiont' 213]|uniref:hypothetical protein n=1 Tax=Nostoc sp. 'Peltigera membranacea cyanobiont' 213 TaxID=2014530 RepID=UPI000B955E46|nr:hypothetical protein [Nostoc sp. 'Peltigera membranacea cyanobiont' 213]OYD87129.1 hypothetical protein CDG77_31105 [Nostoc sp. 'Peltigera membranacea cyanobiont' 213]OYE00331.1 hypothetical protein CDG79_35740 [Nostoc sp. 'Peltigera membranacea cyanobiont' 232]